MPNTEEIVSLIVRTIGAGDAEKLAKVLESTGMSADKAKAAVEKLNKTTEQAGRGGDGYAAQEKKMDRFARSIDPVAAKLDALNKKAAYFESVAVGGGPNAQRAAALLEKTKQRYQEVASAAGIAANATDGNTKATRASAYQYQNLMYQLNDVISGLAMGQRPMQVLAQQGGQIAQIGMQMNSPFKALFSPTGLLVGGALAAAAAFAIVLARAATLEGQIRSLNTAAVAYNNTAFSADYLQSQANNTARLGFSRSDSLAATQSLLGYRSLSASTVRGIQSASGVYAVATDQEIGEAMSKLGDAFSKGYDGVVALNTQYGFLSRTQAEQVRLLYESGRGTEAAQVALEAFNKQMTSAAEIARDRAATSVKDLGNAIVDALDAIASSPAFAAILAGMERAARATAGYVRSGPMTDQQLYGGLTGTTGGGNAYRGPVASGAIPKLDTSAEDAAAQDAAARKRMNDADIIASEALTASYRRQIEMANALTDVQRDRWEVEQQAIQRYSGEGMASQRAAFIGGELRLREARRANVFDREIYNAPRNLGYQQDIASAALQGPAAQKAAQDMADLQKRLADAGMPTSGARYDALLNASNQNRAASSLTSTNASIYSQQQDIALTQQKIGLIGKSTAAQNEALAVYQATVAMQERYGENLPAEATAYINNARELAKVNAELQKQQASLDEITGFFDQTFDRIGSGLTDAAMEGKSALESLKNVGSAVASQLYQEFFKLIALNPLKNWLFGASSPTITSVGGVIGSIFGGLFADGGKIMGPGGPRSDSILAAVSNGEYIVNADATSKYLPLLDAINDNRIKAFADGGMVSTVAAPKIASVAGGSNSTVFSPTISITMTGSGGASGQADMEKMGQMITGQLDTWFNDRMRREQSPGGTLYGRLTA